MSFDEEWAQQKQAVTDQQSAHTRLNQLPADNSGTTGPAGSPPDLLTAPAAKKKAANTIQNELEPGTRGNGPELAARGAMILGWSGLRVWPRGG
ncbi:hypothetical protein F0344_12710 [Streptomyces finlayi]|uniref:Uncharacterized protein n=1 Tax=Streptomyces finlayi TaxID=67296 RepID=A0A7G7BJ51_9ACTN|nr:hypothetical protein [Streptomyces finlayi]QNE75366.1 hypothetical protein F0344_12710 [Streptomyces finlayi]